MAHPCATCTHRSRAEIEAQIAEGVPNRRIASEWGLSDAAVRRHIARHIGPRLRVSLARREVLPLGNFVDRLVQLAADAQDVKVSALAVGDGRLALAAMREERESLETLMTRTGIEDDEAINVLGEAEDLASALSQLLPAHPSVATALADALDLRGAHELSKAIRGRGALTTGLGAQS